MGRRPFLPPRTVARLIDNGRRSAAGEQTDPAPVVKLFTRMPGPPGCSPRSTHAIPIGRSACAILALANPNSVT